MKNDGGMVFGGLVPMAAERARWVGRSKLLATAAVVALAATACSSSHSLGSTASAGATVKDGSGKGGSTSATPTTPPVKDPALHLKDKTKVSYRKAVKITVTDGTLVSMQVSTKTGGTELDGNVSESSSSWSSEAAPKPNTSFKAVANLKDSAGKTHSETLSFKSAAVSSANKVSFGVTPNGGTTVGIGQPIRVQFYSPVTQRAAIEKVMTVSATTPSGKSVVGSWHWLNSQQIDWRPKNFWTPGTKVSLDMKIAGVKAAANRYGRQDYSQTFKIGSSHITRVDARTDRLKVYRDGKLVNTWLTGTGKRGLETYSGIYTVLGKSAVVKMDSCSARVTCDKKDPDYYDENEYWATRLTSSGTFVHAAGWDGMLGRANTSHGCIHLADAKAKDFYNHAVMGDVVIVTNTGRGPQDRINTQDPGLYDWNLSWKTWKAGSALKS
jgi:lipoprotein-anchoring transpeptidase ErfK/SrfK